MAKFCTNCGNPLKDGKCENCDKEKETKKVEKEEVQEKKTTSVNIKANNSIGIDIVAIFKNIITKPFDTMKAIYETGNAKVAWILIGICSAIGGLVTYLLSKQLTIGMLQAYVNKINSIATLMGEKADVAEIQQSITMVETMMGNMFMTIFITGVLYMAVYFIIYALVTKLCVGNMFKGKGTVTDYLLVIAGAAVLNCVFGVAATVVSYFSWKLALIVLILGGIAFIVATIQGFVKLLGAKKERLCYSVAISIIGTTVLVSIIYGMFANSLWQKEINKYSVNYGVNASSQIIR